MNITALMPLKKESERVKEKNIRLFCGKPLFYFVLETLHNSKYIDQIIVNTDCEVISSMITQDFPQCILLNRPLLLVGNHIVMNQLIEHDILYAKNEHILQTHSTNPLVTKETIDNTGNAQLISFNGKDYIVWFEVMKVDDGHEIYVCQKELK